MMSTTIRVSRETRDKLADLGRKNDSYEDIILRLINFYESEDHK